MNILTAYRQWRDARRKAAQIAQMQAINAARDAAYRAEQDKAAAAKAASDNDSRLAYYKQADGLRLKADQAAGIAASPLPLADLYAHYVTPPPTPEQWATLTAEQKADTLHPVLF